MITKLMALLTAFIISLGSISTAFLPKAPKPVSQEVLSEKTTYLKKKPISDTICYIDASALPSDEKHTIICLQGIVAKKSASIFVKIRGEETSYFDEIRKAGKTIIKTDDNGQKWTTESLLRKFATYIGDSGYCVYKETDLAYGLDTAVNYATINSWLPVSERLVPLAESCGLTKKMDLVARSDDLSLQEEFFDTYKDRFSKDAVVHVSKRMHSLRDIAIQQGFFCFYNDHDSKGIKLIEKVLKDRGYNTAVLGWVEDEKKEVAVISACGCWLNPTDFCTNNSILAFIGNELPDYTAEKGKAATDETKHYICLLYSDGDNCQWIQGGYGEYFNTRKYYPDIKMTWSFSPFLVDYCPSIFARVRNAGNSDNQLCGGPSGIGYCNLTRYPVKALDEYSTLSAAAMKRSGQNIMVSLDDYTTFKDSRMKYALSYFSRFDNIDGGLLFLDPNCYRSGRGKIWFIDGKPFVSTRLSLWCQGGIKDVTEEWVKEQADIINSYKADIHSVNGYSLVCVQAWTMGVNWTDVFLKALDDDVVVLNAADFIATIQQNVPHKNALPDTGDPSPIL